MPFARIVRPGWGVVHHRMGMVLFMQLFVVVWQNDRWEVAALQNSRLTSLAAAK